MSGPVVFALRALLAAGLYAFLVWALLTLWREVKQQSGLLAARKAPPITLSLQFDDISFQLYHFNQPEVTIGRSPACECLINEDSISSLHARLSFHHGQWWLEDLASTNGTYLNNEKLTTPTVVISGDEIRCGENHILVAFPGENLHTSVHRQPQDEN